MIREKKNLEIFALCQLSADSLTRSPAIGGVTFLSSEKAASKPGMNGSAMAGIAQLTMRIVCGF